MSNDSSFVGCSTDASLREKLNKIMSSDYFTTPPEMKAPVEVAAAAGTYGSFQVPPVHGPVVSVDAPVQVQGSTFQYEQVSSIFLFKPFIIYAFY